MTFLIKQSLTWPYFVINTWITVLTRLWLWTKNNPWSLTFGVQGFRGCPPGANRIYSIQSNLWQVWSVKWKSFLIKSFTSLNCKWVVESFLLIVFWIDVCHLLEYSTNQLHCIHALLGFVKYNKGEWSWNGVLFF